MQHEQGKYRKLIPHGEAKMKIASAIATAATLALAQPAAAQAPAAQGTVQARHYDISREALASLTSLQKAVNAKDETAYPPALAAAQAEVRTTDDKYVIAKLTLQHAEQSNDAPARLAAYQAVLASGGADASETQLLNHNVSVLAAQTGNWALVESVLTPMVAANPSDIDNNVNLARAKLELKKDTEALPLLLRAIQLTEASGRPALEAWYRNALALAYHDHNEAAFALMKAALLKNYPETESWLRSCGLLQCAGPVARGQ
jgi:hypothetical protein